MEITVIVYVTYFMGPKSWEEPGYIMHPRSWVAAWERHQTDFDAQQILYFLLTINIPDQLAIGTMSDCNFDPALAVEMIIIHLTLPTTGIILNL